MFLQLVQWAVQPLNRVNATLLGVTFIYIIIVTTLFCIVCMHGSLDSFCHYEIAMRYYDDFDWIGEFHICCVSCTVLCFSLVFLQRANAHVHEQEVQIGGAFASILSTHSVWHSLVLLASMCTTSVYYIIRVCVIVLIVYTHRELGALRTPGRARPWGNPVALMGFPVL